MRHMCSRQTQPCARCEPPVFPPRSLPLGCFHMLMDGRLCRPTEEFLSTKEGGERGDGRGDAGCSEGLEHVTGPSAAREPHGDLKFYFYSFVVTHFDPPEGLKECLNEGDDGVPPAADAQAQNFVQVKNKSHLHWVWSDTTGISVCVCVGGAYSPDKERGRARHPSIQPVTSAP